MRHLRTEPQRDVGRREHRRGPQASDAQGHASRSSRQASRGVQDQGAAARGDCACGRRGRDSVTERADDDAADCSATHDHAFDRTPNHDRSLDRTADDDTLDSTADHDPVSAAADHHGYGLHPPGSERGRRRLG
jgi:hypothetical protein